MTLDNDSLRVYVKLRFLSATGMVQWLQQACKSGSQCHVPFLHRLDSIFVTHKNPKMPKSKYG